VCVLCLLRLMLILVPRSLSPWWWGCQILLKRRFLQEAHGVTSRKTAFFKLNCDNYGLLITAKSKPILRALNQIEYCLCNEFLISTSVWIADSKKCSTLMREGTYHICSGPLLSTNVAESCTVKMSLNFPATMIDPPSLRVDSIEGRLSVVLHKFPNSCNFQCIHSIGRIRKVKPSPESVVET
jgi:hypothetical protein